MSSRVIVFMLLMLACSPDDPAPSDGGSSGAASETGAGSECAYCGEEFLDVRAVHCGEATSSLTVCSACCHSDALEMACLPLCEMGDCTSACAPVEATPDRHQSCLDSCMLDSCPSACSQAAVDVVCEQACTDFLDCAAPGTTCEDTEACMATACAAGA